MSALLGTPDLERGRIKGFVSWVRFYFVAFIVTACCGGMLSIVFRRPADEIATVLAVPIILFVAPPFLLIRSLGIMQFSVLEIPEKRQPSQMEASKDRNLWAVESFLKRLSDAMSGIGLPLGAMSVLATVLLFSAPVYSLVGVRWAIAPVAILSIILFFLVGMIRTAADKRSSLPMMAFGFFLWLTFVSREEPSKEGARRLPVTPLKVWRAVMPPL